MGLQLRPVGPLPAATYWLRRAVLVGVAVLLLAAVRACATGGSERRAQSGAVSAAAQSQRSQPVAPPSGGGGRSAAPASSGPATSAGASAGSPNPSAGVSAGSPAPSAGSPVPSAGSPVPSATAAGPVTCPDEALAVSVRALASAGPARGFRVTVTNTSATACRRDVGPAAVTLTVISGSDRVWSDDDCAPAAAPSPAPAAVVLRPGAPAGQVLTWPGSRSRPGCRGVRSRALPGTYRVRASIGGLRGAQDVFTVS